MARAKRWQSIKVDLPHDGYYLVRTPDQDVIGGYRYTTFVLNDGTLACAAKHPNLDHEKSEWCDLSKL